DAAGVDEPHPLHRARSTEQGPAGAEHDREELQAELVDEVVLEQGLRDPGAASQDDVPLELALEVRDGIEQRPAHDYRVIPGWLLERRRDDVLRHAVQPVRERSRPRRPATREPFVGPPAHQERIVALRVVERKPEEVRPVLDRSHPAAALEALVARGILEDAVDGEVVADDDPAHAAPPPFPATLSV